MGTIQVDLAGVRETLLLTLYTRVIDSQSQAPILGDRRAEEIARQLDYDFAKLKVPRKEGFGGAIRAKLLDDCTTEFVTQHPAATVLDLGCGLDSRFERVKPPRDTLWFDVDYLDVITLRRHFYPERDGYHMLGTSITEPHWLDEIPAERPVMIVADGLLPFLVEEDIKRLFRRLTDHFRSGQIVFNGYTRLASRLMKYHPSIRALGITTASQGFDDPREPERWSPRLKLRKKLSIIGSPYVARTPRAYRVTCHAMSIIPTLRKEGGWVLLYEF